MTAEEEKRLVQRAMKGSEAAFEELVRSNEKLVYNAARKLTGNPDDAFDVSQEAFIKAYNNLGSFRGDSRFSVWLYRLTYNCAMDFLRRNRDSNVMSMTAEDGGDIQINVPDSAPLPEEEAEREELRREVREAVMSLDEDKRRVIVMREFNDMSYTDIAEALGIEEGTVKSRLARARAALAEILMNRGTFPQGKASKGKKGGRAV